MPSGFLAVESDISVPIGAGVWLLVPTSLYSHGEVPLVSGLLDRGRGWVYAPSRPLPLLGAAVAGTLAMN